MRFAVRVYDNDDGGGVAEPRIHMDTIYVLSQGKIVAALVPYQRGARSLEATCQCVLFVDATYLPVAYCTAMLQAQFTSATQLTYL